MGAKANSNGLFIPSAVKEVGVVVWASLVLSSHVKGHNVGLGVSGLVFVRGYCRSSSPNSSKRGCTVRKRGLRTFGYTAICSFCSPISVTLRLSSCVFLAKPARHTHVGVCVSFIRTIRARHVGLILSGKTLDETRRTLKTLACGLTRSKVEEKLFSLFTKETS